MVVPVVAGSQRHPGPVAENVARNVSAGCHCGDGAPAEARIDLHEQQIAVGLFDELDGADFDCPGKVVPEIYKEVRV